jgi:hypothetical protein
MPTVGVVAMYSVMRVLRQVSLFFLLFLCGCAAADFKKPISGFSEATKLAAASFEEYAKITDGEKQEQRVEKIIASAATLDRASTDDCTPNGKRCRVTAVIDGKSQPIGSEPFAPLFRRLMAGVVTYSGNLEAIANANTAGDIKTAVDATKTQVVGLAKAIDSYNAQNNPRSPKLEPRITSFASPVADAILFGLSKFLEQLKLAALRNATSNMDIIFPSITQYFKTFSAEGLALKQIKLRNAYREANEAFAVPNLTPKRLANLQTAANAYDVALSTEPAKIFDDLRKAHRALTLALNEPEPSFEQLWPLLQNVADEASKVAVLVNVFEKAAKGGN